MKQSHKAFLNIFIFFNSFILLGYLFCGPQALFAQQGKYKAYFDEAYRQFPTIPEGLLESVAYNNTRLNHLSGKTSCQDLPDYYGVMGLVADGKDYFQNSLAKVASLSRYSEEEIKNDPRINILAYAEAYAKLQQNKRLANNRVENHQPIIAELSEIPDDTALINEYARDQQFYGVLKEMQEPHTRTGHRLNRSFDLKDVFGEENLKVLSGKRVSLSAQGILNTEGDNFRTGKTTCTRSKPKPDFKGALWKAAHPNNYGSRNGEKIQYVTIHTIQGSYASAISWFRNKRARVSAHYIIRASDGQVTQMVCETDKGFHVRTDNASAIGIEHEGFVGDGLSWYTNEMYASSAELVRDICKRHGINPLKTYGGPSTMGIRELSNTCYHIKGHQHFRGNNHVDPGPFWDWDRFFRLVNPAPKTEVFTSRKGEVFDSGKKSGNYGDQERKTYLIKPKNAASVTLKFESFELEGSKDEPFDYLDIFDGPDENGRLLGRFTGTQSPGILVANSGQVFMEFRSDCRVNKAGWHLKYTAQSKNGKCPPPKDLIAKDIFPMGATLKWTAPDEADKYLLFIRRKNIETRWQVYESATAQQTVTGLGANGLYQWQVRSVCGADSSAWTGGSFLTSNIGNGITPQVFTLRLNEGKFFDSGGLAGGYADKENYLYRIIPPNGKRVKLTFSSFETEVGGDVLTIYDGTNINNDPVLGKFSGKNKPDEIVSSKGAISILFRSNARTSAPGWVATWRTDDASAIPTPPIKIPEDDPSDPIVQPVDPPINPDVKPVPDPELNPRVDELPFNPVPFVHRYAPTSTPDLKGQYKGAFTLNFKDRDRSGKGFANRFYTMATGNSGTYQSYGEAGFLYENFDSPQLPGWKVEEGKWNVASGRLIQSNTSSANTNIHIPLKQRNDEVYVYHWQARMTGEADNLRHGFHFFCSEPEKSNRGNSYFVIIRDAEGGDFIEIYKSAFNKFDRKVKKEVTLTPGKTYDYKVICNPQKGRIEVYLDNKFKASWVDRYPLFSGEGISLRTGGCKVAFDNLRVYKARENAVSVPISGSRALLSNNTSFKVASLVVDRNIHWSKVGESSGKVGNPSSTPSQNPTSTTSPSTPEPTTDADFSVNGDFEFKWKKGNSGQTFFLPTDYDGKNWTANRALGFLHEDYSEATLAPEWVTRRGTWKLSQGKFQQKDPGQGNSNAYVSLTQGEEAVYMYHAKVKMLSKGNNRRLGLHFFSSDATQENRGNSYLVWLRFHDNQEDRIEVYKAENGNMPGFNASKNIDLQSNVAYDLKVVYDPTSGKIDVYLNNLLTLSWTDTGIPHRIGRFVSLRTGNAEAEFDDLRVYQLAKKDPLDISVGSSKENMLRFKSQDGAPAGRILLLRQSASGRWNTLEQQTVEVK
ncbi:MAG: CUB domain-containing protein [Bacteroidota bacterium]